MLRDGSIEEHDGTNATDSHGDRCDRVHRTLKRIVKARGALDAQEAAALREAAALMLWRRYGCASLVDYMEREMGYSPRAALERLRVAKAIVDLPAIAEALDQGELSYSAARELTRVATADTEADWLAAAAEKNVREIENSVAGHRKGDRPNDPIDPTLRTHVLRFEVKAETYALVRQAMTILEREHGERLDDDALIRTLCRRVIDGGDACDERTRAPYQIAVTTCEQCKRGWQDGGGVTVEMSVSAIEAARCDAQHIGSIDGAETTRATQTIPPAKRRKVLRRDHGRCRVPGCRSKSNIDIHHVTPRAEGGTHDVDMMVCLCEAHHLALHEGRLVISGDAPNFVFTRYGQNRFETESHVVDTRKALTALGFKRHEVSEAIERTRTHDYVVAVVSRAKFSRPASPVPDRARWSQCRCPKNW